MRRLVLVVLSGVLLGGAGCVTPTLFRGSAMVTGGAAECRARCGKLGLTFAGMVMMGEYTNGCICSAKGAKLGRAGLKSAAEVGGAVAAKVRAQQEQSTANQTRSPASHHP